MTLTLTKIYTNIAEVDNDKSSNCKDIQSFIITIVTGLLIYAKYGGIVSYNSDDWWGIFLFSFGEAYKCHWCTVAGPSHVTHLVV